MQKLDKMLLVRVTAKIKRRFNTKAKKHGTPSEVHRELISAFIEDRLTIEPPNSTEMESLYEPRK